MAKNKTKGIEAALNSLAAYAQSSIYKKGISNAHALPDGYRERVEAELSSLGGAGNTNPQMLEDTLSLLKLNGAFSECVIEYVFKSNSSAQKSSLTFMIEHWGQLERMASRWFEELEGMPCSSDKGRTLCNRLWDHYSTGASLELNYAQEYTYHLPEISLVHPGEILQWFDVTQQLIKGQVFPFMNFYKKTIERIQQRKKEPDLPLHRILPADDSLKGKPAFQILAALWEHRPAFRSDVSVLHCRIRIIREAEYMFPGFIYDQWSQQEKENVLALFYAWAFHDTPLDTSHAHWPKTLFQHVEDAMEWMAAYVSMYEDGGKSYRKWEKTLKEKRCV